VDKGHLGTREIRQFQKLCKALDTIFEKEPRPGLRPVTFGQFQHCWTLSVMQSICGAATYSVTPRGHPVLIDPAVYLFGGTRVLEYNASRQNL